MIEKRSQKRGKTVKVTFSVPVEWLPTPVAVNEHGTANCILDLTLPEGD